MRILLANKFLFPQGGADKHVLQLRDLLRARGHEVIDFAMADPRNVPSDDARYFPSRTDFSRVRFDWQGIRTAARALWSFEAAHKLDALIRDRKPDVIHLHNTYHQLSPSILSVLRRHKIPVVQTLHDYYLISASYNLYAHGGICEHGRNGKYYEYVTHRCVKNSRPASALAMIEKYLDRWTRRYEKTVGTFISPSAFLKKTILDWGVRHDDIVVLPNFVDIEPRRSANPGTYVMFLGRLSAEKGVATLLRAARGSTVPIKIVGGGPEEGALKRQALDLKLGHVEFTGQKTGAELDALYEGAMAVAVPSEWYENCPLVILEAFARGKPVIGADIGGIPDLVTDNVNGLLYAAGDADVLRSAMDRLASGPDLRRALADGAFASAANYSADRYVTKLLEIYARVQA